MHRKGRKFTMDLKYFKIGEFGNFQNFPEKIQKNILYTAEILDYIREKFGQPIMVTSAYRPKDNSGPHKIGRAIDFQPVTEFPGWQKIIIEILKKSDFDDFRLFCEKSLRSPDDGWCHIDRNYKKNGKFWVGYQKKNGPYVYKKYAGKLPKEYM